MRGRRAVLGVLAIGVTVLALAVTSRGARIAGSGEATYIAAARHLAAGSGYTDYSLREITTWPPGLSATLAAMDPLGIDPADGVRWLNALAYGALVVVTYALTGRHARSPWVALVAAGAVAASVAMLDVFTRALTEPVFCVLLLALVLTVEVIVATHARKPRMLVTAGLLAAAAFSYRYAAAPFLFFPIPFIIVAARVDGWRAALRRAGGYAIVALVVPVAIVARNLAVGPGPVGPRFSSTDTPLQVTRDLSRVLRGWLQAGAVVAPAIGYLLLGAALVVIVCAVVASRADWLALVPLVAFIGLYVAALAFSALTTNLDPIDTRLLAPIFAPLVILVVAAADQLAAHSRRAAFAGACAAVLWLGLAATVTVDRLGELRSHSYNASRFSSSAFLAAVEALPRDAIVVSNAADGIYVRTSREPVFDSPSVVEFRSRDRTHDVERLIRRVQTGAPVFLAWYLPNRAHYLASPAELRRAGLQLQPVSSSKLGTIYRLTV